MKEQSNLRNVAALSTYKQTVCAAAIYTGLPSILQPPLLFLKQTCWQTDWDSKVKKEKVLDLMFVFILRIYPWASLTTRSSSSFSKGPSCIKVNHTSSCRGHIKTHSSPKRTHKHTPVTHLGFPQFTKQKKSSEVCSHQHDYMTTVCRTVRQHFEQIQDSRLYVSRLRMHNTEISICSRNMWCQ